MIQVLPANVLKYDNVFKYDPGAPCRLASHPLSSLVLVGGRVPLLLVCFILYTLYFSCAGAIAARPYPSGARFRLGGQLLAVGSSAAAICATHVAVLARLHLSHQSADSHAALPHTDRHAAHRFRLSIV